MFKTILLFSVFGLLPHPQVETRQVRAGQWRIERMHDRFTGAVTCRAHLGAMHIDGHALLIDFGAQVQTDVAVYRVDSGPAISVQADPFNAQYHAGSAGDAPIDNPSAGTIAIPVSELKTARDVWIRITPNTSPRRFDIRGLEPTISVEATLGCP